jgi:hypothetical protein
MGDVVPDGPANQERIGAVVRSCPDVVQGDFLFELVGILSSENDTDYLYIK